MVDSRKQKRHIFCFKSSMEWQGESVLLSSILGNKQQAGSQVCVWAART